MIVTVHREHLLPALLKIAGVVEKKQTLPILGNILFKIADGKMLLIGTDSELEIRTVSAIDSGEDGLAFTLSARKFGDICKALPENAEIRFTKDGERISIRSGRSRFTLGTLPFEDFPSLEIAPAEHSFTVESALLKRLLEQTAFSMGHQDARYYLNGLLLDLTPERLRCVATDGHRLALSEGAVATGQQELQVLLPRKAVFELIRLLDNPEQTVTLEISIGFCRFKIGNTVFTTKLIDGKFPDYQRVIPKNMDKTAEFVRKNVKEAMWRSAILSTDKYKGIKLTFRPGELQMEATNAEQEDSLEELEIDYQGDEVSIGFNISYFMDILGAIGCERVAIDFVDGSSSALLRDPEDKNRLYVVMPMRL